MSDHGYRNGQPPAGHFVRLAMPDRPHYLWLMFRSLWSLVLTLSCGASLQAQLTVTNTQTPAWLVQNLLLGPGVTVSNITFNGVPANAVTEQAGEFNGVNTTLGIGQGLILATGNVANALGPNDSGSSTLGGGNFGQSDPDLAILSAPQVVNDAAVLEFDFVPNGDSLKFDFVFGSDEYLEFVNSINDIFGFFLSGPGFAGPFSNGAVNIALIPGTTSPVTINTVNDVVNASFYVVNGTGMNFPYNSNPQYVQYDGFTTVITARAEVVCGLTYHIKIAIGDASDTSWDSAVFLKAGSFQSNQVSLVSEVIAGGIDSLFYEGCGEALLYLVRGAPLDLDTVQILVGGTAIEGTDFTPVPDEIIFGVGQDSALLSINAILDQLVEGQETIDIMVVNNGPCGSDTATVEILLEEAPFIQVTLSNDTSLTCNDSTLVQATITGGFGNYGLDWDQGIPDGAYSGWVAPSQTTTYTLTVTDDCGVITTAQSVTIFKPIPPPLVVQAIPDITVYCPETPVQLQALVQGGNAPYQYSWSNPLGFNAVANVAPPVTQTYGVTVTDLCGRDTSDQVTVTVDYDTVQVMIAPDTVICINDTIVLTAQPTLGWGGYTYLWNDASTADTLAVSPTFNSIYTVAVMDGCGIYADDAVGVGVNAPVADFWWGGSTQVNNYPIPFLDRSFGATSWSWDFGGPGLTSTDQNPFFTYPEPGDYVVMLAIEDPLGCRDTTYRSITVDQEFNLYIPNAFSPNGDGFNEVFLAQGTGIKEFRLRIFDRWGELLFETNDILQAWDGSYKGGLATTGVYVYQIRVKALIGEAYDKTGHVTLLR
jgi:gliding motility-associated-like protein